MSSIRSEVFIPPVAPVKLATLDGAYTMARAVSDQLHELRTADSDEIPLLKEQRGYLQSEYILDAHVSHFGTGEAKVRFNESVRGADLYIFCDITNNSVTYKMRGKINHMSPDNHFQDLKRMISAANGKAHRITVIMPFLYEGRQHKRSAQESLDCALALRELSDYGVSNIITFDAHDPRVMNAVPLMGFDSFMPTYQFLQALYNSVPDFKVDKEHFMVVSPDEGAMERSIYFSNILKVDMGTFYKRRDYSKVVDGVNPIIAHEFLGDSVEGKDVVVIDDMIASGGSMIDVCRKLKARGCRRVFVCATFGLFTKGMAPFDKLYEEGNLDKLITTNLCYQTPELLSRPYYETANMYKYLANIINVLNHDISTTQIRSTTVKINDMMTAKRG